MLSVAQLDETMELVETTAEDMRGGTHCIREFPQLVRQLQDRDDYMYSDYKVRLLPQYNIVFHLMNAG